jgi:hypothetical protein
MRQANAATSSTRNISSDIRGSPLAYESLFNGQELQPETSRRICEFLGVEPRADESTLVKVNPNRSGRS